MQLLRDVASAAMGAGGAVMKLVIKSVDPSGFEVRLGFEWTEEKSFIGDMLFRFTVSDGVRRAVVLIDVQEVMYCGNVLHLVANKMRKLGPAWKHVCDALCERNAHVLRTGET